MLADLHEAMQGRIPRTLNRSDYCDHRFSEECRLFYTQKNSLIYCFLYKIYEHTIRKMFKYWDFLHHLT